MQATLGLVEAVNAHELLESGSVTGTLRGVRGFGDKQILTYPNGTSVFQQPDKARSDLGYLLPYKLTDQIDGDLDHSWVGDHAAPNGGQWNNSGRGQDRRDDGLLHPGRDPVPVRARRRFTICDGYHQAIMAPTSPNRMYLWTGTSSGFITNPDDYTVDFGPDAGTAEVTTYPDQLQQAGISWQVYTNDQVGDSGSFPDFFLGDFGDNPLWFYQQFNATNSRNGGTGPLATRGAVTPWKTDAGARAEQDPRRVRAVVVHQRRQEQQAPPGVVDRRPGRR